VFLEPFRFLYNFFHWVINSKVIAWAVFLRQPVHLLYGEARGNASAARRIINIKIYGEYFPERVFPSRCTFMELHLRL
jgi:hypothetical protein